MEGQKEELPIGEARKLNELSSKEWSEHLFLFSRVKNKVLVVNPHFRGTLPLKLEKGKPTPLGLFAENVFWEKPAELPEGKHALEVWLQHNRSVILGRVIFADKEGRRYRDIDLKGIGWLAGRRVLDLKKRTSGGYSGLLDKDTAFYDYARSEEFLKAGIRTSRVLGIIELKELITRGKKLSLREAAELGIINKDFHPVIEVRAFVTKFRIEDTVVAWSGKEIEEGQLAIEDAKRLVSQELGKTQTLSDQKYLEWFVKTLGYNVGLMHKNGWLHKYLTIHNITLDCRIVDLDSVAELKSNQERLNDIGSLTDVFFVFKERLRLADEDDPQLEELRRQFQKSYDAVFPPKERKKYFEKFRRMSKKTR